MKAELIMDADIVGKKKIFIKRFSRPYFSHPFHFHQFCELVWIEKGHGKVIVGDYVGDFSEGELILEGAGLPHLWRCDDVYYKKSRQQLTRAICIYFPSGLINSLTDDGRIEVARICNLTPPAFCRYFKAKTQKNFSRFLNEIRIGHACTLLQDEKVSIKNLCYECGYNNPVNFFKFFKLITGMTPGVYRKTLRAQHS